MNSCVLWSIFVYQNCSVTVLGNENKKLIVECVQSHRKLQKRRTGKQGVRHCEKGMTKNSPQQIARGLHYCTQINAGASAGFLGAPHTTPEQRIVVQGCEKVGFRGVEKPYVSPKAVDCCVSIPSQSFVYPSGKMNLHTTRHHLVKSLLSTNSFPRNH